MKNLYKSFFVLVLGIGACSSVMGQKSSSEYDDLYYIPSDKKTVESSDKTEVVPSSTVTPHNQGLSDYEKYINSLSKQNTKSKQIQPQLDEDSLEYAEDPNYAGSEYAEKDGSTYVTNNYYSNPNDYYYASQIRRFYDPFYSAGYFDPWYSDPYFYGGGFSMSIGFGFGMSYGYGYPYYGYGNPYYGYGNPYYGYGYGYGYPYYGYGYVMAIPITVTDTVAVMVVAICIIPITDRYITDPAVLSKRTGLPRHPPVPRWLQTPAAWVPQAQAGQLQVHHRMHAEVTVMPTAYQGIPRETLQNPPAQ